VKTCTYDTEWIFIECHIPRQRMLGSMVLIIDLYISNILSDFEVTNTLPYNIAANIVYMVDIGRY